MTALKKNLGKRAEKIAEDFYKKNYYTLIKRNYCCRGSELDLIFRKHSLLVIVEVKLRKERKALQEPLVEDLLPFSKRSALVRGTTHFLQNNPIDYTSIRFDLCLVRYKFLGIEKQLKKTYLKKYEDILRN